MSLGDCVGGGKPAKAEGAVCHTLRATGTACERTRVCLVHTSLGIPPWIGAEITSETPKPQSMNKLQLDTSAQSTGRSSPLSASCSSSRQSDHTQTL